MEPQAFIIIPVALVFIGLIILGIYISAKRRKELRLWAESNGWRFDPSKDRGMDNRFPEFKVLKKGSNRYAYNIIRGNIKSLLFLAFDYHYKTGSGKNTHHYHFSSVILDSLLPLQNLYIRPEGFFDKITDFFGFDDIDFESAEFSRKFYVKAENKRWAYDVIHARTMEFLMNSPRFTIQFHGSPQTQARDENQLVRSLRSLFVLVENYPQLKASRHFLSLQEELSNTEDRIQATRRFYNANVRDLNIRIESFPSNIVASLFGFQKAEFFEIQRAYERTPPKVGV